MPIDLSSIIPVVDDLIMTDECIVSRDSELTGDDLWDDNTGTYTAPDSDEDTQYSGRCSLWQQKAQATVEFQGGVGYHESRSFLAIPFDEEADIQPEDVVVITSSVNPSLEGVRYLIDSEEFGTFDVHRTFKLKTYEQVPGA
jgi:hypothetical protein